MSVDSHQAHLYYFETLSPPKLKEPSNNKIFRPAISEYAQICSSLDRHALHSIAIYREKATQ